ncbi:hypothetical protein D3C81_1551020 [compost metagenome]
MWRQVAAFVGCEFDAEPPARHAQALDLLFDRDGELLGCLLAQGAQLDRPFLIVLGIGRQFFAQALDRLVAGIQAFQLLHQLLLQVGQFGRVHAMFARQGVDGVEALFQGLQAHGVGVEIVEEAVEFAYGFFYLDLCAGDEVGGFTQRLGGVGCGAQAIEAGGEGAEHIA